MLPPTFTYKLHFVGLACLIPRKDTAALDEVLVALPDGRRYPNPCDAESDPIHDHYPYLIVPMKNMQSSTIEGRILNRCFVVDLTNAGSLIFDASTSGTIPVDHNDLVANGNGLHWHNDIDSTFTLDQAAPAGTILTTLLKQGKFEARRIPYDPTTEDGPIITEVTIAEPSNGTVAVIMGDRALTFDAGAEIVIANVGPEWAEGVEYDDEDSHFYIYYRLRSNTTPGCQLPPVKTTPATTSTHPYLEQGLGLRVSCSNTIYP